MNRNRYLILLAVVLFAALCGCQEAVETPTAPGDPGQISGEIPAAGDFDMLVTAGGDDPPFGTGPFLIRGRDLHYDAVAGALVVDLTVENRGETVQREPVALVFEGLIPADVEVINPDNGVHGPGATIVFEFANDDNLWTPGEVSLPREVWFKVAPETPIGFYARLELGGGPLSGVIAGRVWEDRNLNGEMEPGEPGLPRARVMLQGDFDIRDCARCVPEAMTDSAGYYRFDGLPAGAYVVQAEPPQWRQPTRPTRMHVLLVATTDGVSRFEQADFGFGVLVPQPTVTLRPVKDTVLRSDVDSRRNDNYGCNLILDVGGSRGGGDVPAGGPDGIRSLLEFDLNHDIPDPRRNSLVRARLEMTIDHFQEGVGQAYQLELNRIVPSGVRTPWVEGNGTEFSDLAVEDSTACVWVDPAFGVAWVGAGDGGDANNVSQPDFDPTPVATTSLHQNSMGPGAVVSWDVTDVVDGWIRGEYPNLGLVLRDPTSDGAHFKSLWFHSREGESLIGGPGPLLVLQFGE